MWWHPHDARLFWALLVITVACFVAVMAMVLHYFGML